MMKKAILFVLLLTLSLTTLPVADVFAAENEVDRVLVVYDSLAVGSANEGNVEQLQRLLVSFGVEVTICSYDRYQEGTMNEFKKVVAIRNAFDLPDVSQTFQADFANYKGEYMHIGAFPPERVIETLDLSIKVEEDAIISLAEEPYSQVAVDSGTVPLIVHAAGKTYGNMYSANDHMQGPYGSLKDGVAYVSYLSAVSLSEILLADVMKDWLQASLDSRAFLLFSNVTPFSDFELLESMSDRLYALGIPFVISASPVFSNTDFPAMQRYINVLKYAQAHNGSILIEAPVVSSEAGLVNESLKDHMNFYMNQLADQGIVPLGMATELYWLDHPLYVEQGLHFFDSVIFFSNESAKLATQSESVQSFISSPYSINMDEFQDYLESKKKFIDLPFNVAFTYSFPETQYELDEITQSLADSWIHFSDYKTDRHSVQTNLHHMTSAGGHLFIDNHSVDLNSTSDTTSPHIYIQENEKSLSALFSLQNRIFSVIIILILIIFVFLLIIGHRLYKRKFVQQEREL
ncbi:DUF2334 domain-containing protein [Paenibacillus sp. HB172176]|uniref:DUF2334 domain-containing protein n=1 Tax=Paenibacillus sp. HB172176 TaxID=2493690 RepID=UPI0014396029|nr:DUF2334 domain-containing protein [Paenibacillus sp. HB172176]